MEVAVVVATPVIVVAFLKLVVIFLSLLKSCWNKLKDIPPIDVSPIMTMNPFS